MRVRFEDVVYGHQAHGHGAAVAGEDGRVAEGAAVQAKLVDVAGVAARTSPAVEPSRGRWSHKVPTSRYRHVLNHR
jgi:hypothetical protein